MNKTLRTALSLALFTTALPIIPTALLAQKPAVLKESRTEFEKRTKWWREARFGMFIHWGLYAVPADSSQGLAEWYFNNHSTKDPATGKERKLQVSEYAQFASRFNPVKFDAKEWVSIAKNAGMKYIVLTSKHHDGFALWESKVSPYNIVSATPFKRDPIKELAEECKKQGIQLCFYHSIMDWHHPDYLPRRDWDKRPATGANMTRYIAYMKEQIKELVTQYGKIGVLWFDGEWENTWTHDLGKDLYNYTRSLQPSILVNNRVDKGRAGMAGMNVSNEFMGDFGTPEQEVPPSGFSDGRLWETCMTLNDTWGYAKNDNNWKSSTTLIRHLCDIAGKGGNFLLNVGPTDLGDFTPQTKDRLAKLGAWMKRNGQAIYGTQATPFRRLSFPGTCTRKGNKLYVMVYHWGDQNAIELKGLDNIVRSAKVLGTGEQVSLYRDNRLGGVSEGLRLIKPKNVDPDATVIEITCTNTIQVKEPPITIRAYDASTTLKAEDATLVGGHLQLEQKGNGSNIGFWTDPLDFVKWRVEFPLATFEVTLDYACANDSAGGILKLEIANQGAIHWTVESTGGWDKFKAVTLPQALANNGAGFAKDFLLKAEKMGTKGLINIRSITLKRIEK